MDFLDKCLVAFLMVMAGFVAIMCVFFVFGFYQEIFCWNNPGESKCVHRLDVTHRESEAR